jgi:hypothetical protein
MKLTSLYESNSDLSLEEAVKIFHDECKPFQKEIGFDGTFDFETLKRGMKNKPKLFIGNVRPDRRPSDTPLPIHEFMDNWFYKKFGVKFRSNAMFVTKSRGSAQIYGDVYIVFPIGEFKYCYSSTIDDLYATIANKIESKLSSYYAPLTKEKFNDFLSDDDNLKFALDIVEKILTESKYVDNDLKYVSYYPEIMINCKSYLAIKSDLYDDFIKLYQETYK